MRCSEIINALNTLSPPSFAEEWDNVGLLVGRKSKDVNRICLALDATFDVIDEAISMKADMLLTHHPLIFSGLKHVNSDDYVGRRVLKLAQNDICLFSMHTNFDVMGMADAAADEIEIRERKVLEIQFEDEIAREGVGRIGRLPRIMNLEECAQMVKDRFALSNIRVYGDKDRTLEKVAILPGSGADYIDKAIEAGVDVMITGDIKHHDGIDALARGLCLIDAGHFGLERRIFITYLKEYFRREMPQILIEIPKQESPFWEV